MTGTTSRRVNSRTDRYMNTLSFDGSAVRKAEVAANRSARTVTLPRVSARTRRNRAQALSMSKGYVVFLAFMAVIVVLMCVQYLQLKETVTTQLSSNEKLASQLTTLKSENDALYENITDSIDWDHVRDVAINKLGMKYATEDQVVWYNTESDGYVRQYEEVPTAD